MGDSAEVPVDTNAAPSADAPAADAPAADAPATDAPAADAPAADVPAADAPEAAAAPDGAAEAPASEPPAATEAAAADPGADAPVTEPPAPAKDGSADSGPIIAETAAAAAAETPAGDADVTAAGDAEIVLPDVAVSPLDELPVTGETDVRAASMTPSVAPPDPAEPPPPDRDEKKLITVYVDGDSDQTRIRLAKELVNGGVSWSELVADAAPLRLLGDSVPAADQAEEPVADVLARRAAFVATFSESLSSASGAKLPGSIVQIIVGVGTWWRNLSGDEHSAFDGLWDEMRRSATEKLPDSQFHLLTLSDEEEARFEYKAIAFAAKQTLDIDLDCALSLSSDMVACTNGPRRGGAASRFDLKLQDGEAMMAEDEGLSKWEQMCTGTLTKELAPCTAAWEGTASLEGTPHIYAGGESWQVSVAAGLGADGGSDSSMHKLEEALQKLKDSSGSDTPARDRANIVRLYASLEAFFRSPDSAQERERCKLVFAKAWAVDGKPFQANWAAGHFLNAIGIRDEADPATTLKKETPTEEPETGAAITEPEASVAATDADAPATTPIVAPIVEGGAAPSPSRAEAEPVTEGAADTSAVAVANPFTLPPDAGIGSELPASSLRMPEPQKSPELPKPEELTAKSPSSLPGLVVYVVAPAAAASGEAALSAEEYQGLSIAAMRSGASVVLSTSAPTAIAALDFEVARMNKILREVTAFAIHRFRAPGATSMSPLHDLFKALANDDSGVLDVEAIALGLRSLGFPSDAVSAAAALTPDGSNRVSREEFTNALAGSVEQPDLVAVCPEQPDGAASTEDVWPSVRVVSVSSGLLGAEVLQAKAGEATRLSGADQLGAQRNSHGVVLVLAARGRALLEPVEYEAHIRHELRVADELLPPRWPLLWSPGPAEAGLLSEAAAKRPIWSMPKGSGPDTLAAWLRYLLVVRPTAPTSH